MFETDTTRMRPGDLSEAVGLLTRLPVASEGGRGVKAAWAWPVAGALVAAIAGVAGWIALAVGLPPALASALVLGLMVILTGAMHEDGLADCADGFWGGWAVECRLEIMKDSRIGTYGVIALVLSLLMRWSAIAALAEAGTLIAPLVAAAALSRFPMVALMWRLPSVRRGGLSDSSGIPDRDTVVLSACMAALVGVLFAGFAALVALLAVMAAAALAGWVARVKIGGQTGDVLGAAQQLGEIAALAVFAAILT